MRAWSELSRRTEVDDYLAPPRTAGQRPWMTDLFALQRAVADSPSRHKVVTCSRRGGKTVLLSALAIDALETCQHDEGVVYLARTRMIAKDLIWAKLRELVRRHDLGWRMHETELRVENRAGGYLLVRGAEGASPGEELDKLRGLKLRRALADEPATYAETLDALLREVLEPALGDLRGDVVVAGTPGIVCAGTWHDISTGKRPKWTRWAWTIRDNPHFPDADEYLAGAKLENGWSDDDPTYQREYLGQWTADDSAQVYRYLDARNAVADIPGYDRDRWHHVIGVDFGMRDDCAWVVLAAHPHDRRLYAVEARKAAGLLVDDAAAVTAELCQRYRPSAVVGDAGGLGKPYVEQWNARHAGQLGMPAMQSAEKADKRAAIDLLNADLRTGRLLVAPGAISLADEWRVLPWKDAARTLEHPAYPNHLADACLYAWRASHAYLHTPAVPAPTPRDDPSTDTAISREWERYRDRRDRPVWDDE
jgi:hypothetical protein